MSERIIYHHWDGERLWASRGRHILTAGRTGEILGTWGRIDPFQAGFGAAWRRLSRRRIHLVLHLGGDRVLVVLRRLLVIMDSGKRLYEHRPALGSQPLRKGICRLGDGRVLYGEYGPNPERDPVKVMISEDRGATWRVLWRSAPGRVRHIHMVQPAHDLPGHVYVATGDYGEEPLLMLLNAGNGEQREIGGGGQEWRMLALVQDGERLIWGSDNDRGENHIYEWRAGDPNPRPLHPLPGPAYDACRDSRGRLAVATAVEDRRKHRACILIARKGMDWETWRCFRKDPLPGRLFGYGVADFPQGQEELPQFMINRRGLLQGRRMG